MADPVTKERMPAKKRTRYEDDFYTWALQQVELLRAGRFNEIDAENIAEELSDIPHALYDRLQISLKVLLMHMLKWDRQPEHRTRTWWFAIAEQRRRIERLLIDNAGLKAKLEEVLTEAYGDARPWAALECGVVESEFPPKCPYSWEEIVNRPFRVRLGQSSPARMIAFHRKLGAKSGRAALMAVALLTACEGPPTPALCIEGIVAPHSSKQFAAALHPPRERVVALDVRVDRPVFAEWECIVELCADVDVVDSSRSSPANLAVRFLQPGPAVDPLIASGLYLSQYREYTDSTHYMELTQLTNEFPSKIDRSACVRLTSASQ